eukprot:7460056-Pyramimonas_sp.AAC.1
MPSTRGRYARDRTGGGELRRRRWTSDGMEATEGVKWWAGGWCGEGDPPSNIGWNLLSRPR